MITLGELIESGRRSLQEGILPSLAIVAKDVGGTSIPRGRTFVGRFTDQKQVDRFTRTAEMEYPGVARKFKTVKTKDGGIELSLASTDAAKFER